MMYRYGIAHKCKHIRKIVSIFQNILVWIVETLLRLVLIKEEPIYIIQYKKITSVLKDPSECSYTVIQFLADFAVCDWDAIAKLYVT